MSYTEGILGDGAAILKDGVMVPIEQVVSRLNDMDRYKKALDEIYLCCFSHGSPVHPNRHDIIEIIKDARED